MTTSDFRSSIALLTDEECQSLLERETTGRLAFADGDFPMILPVNYVIFDGLVVFRTDAGIKLTNTPMTHVAFEVDGRDGKTAWSVVAQGLAREVTNALGERYEALRQSEIALLAPGEKTHWMAIEVAHLSGRSFPVREQ